MKAEVAREPAIRHTAVKNQSSELSPRPDRRVKARVDKSHIEGLLITQARERFLSAREAVARTRARADRDNEAPTEVSLRASPGPERRM